MNIYKVDLHTHSIISHDGGLRAEHYEKLIENKVLDYVAITDHNETRFARILQQKLGEHIIIGEEIGTTEGEIVGLFLEETISGGQSAEETVQTIKNQNGLVYIPHPFETFRKGLQEDTLEKIAASIDIIEVFNGRGRWRGKNELAQAFATKHHIATAASSDAHCILGFGKTFSRVGTVPVRENIKKLFEHADLNKQYAPLLSLLCPAINKVKNKVVV
jgi:predicted metal-dependent phosphoesterase TrpH